MTRLRSCYPNAVADKESWMMTIATYWEHVYVYSAEAIRLGFKHAPLSFPDWMPSLGQLMDIINRAEKDTSYRPQKLIDNGDAFDEKGLEEIRAVIAKLAEEKAVR